LLDRQSTAGGPRERLGSLPAFRLRSMAGDPFSRTDRRVRQL